MKIFYRVSDKQSLKDRNNLFKESGMPALEKNGFVFAPFKGSWHGQYYGAIQGYSYDISRIREKGCLEMIYVEIIRGEPWIQIYLNIFELSPKIETLSLLTDGEGLKFGMPEKDSTKMRLRLDDYRGLRLFHCFLPRHKIGRYYTQKGYKREIATLKNLIKSDMENIDDFVKRWHDLHKPYTTDFEGNILNMESFE